MRVSVIGGSTVGAETYSIARRVGERLATAGHAVVCGGLGGVMEAACRGAADADGATIGILPGSDPAAANRFVGTPVATGLGSARNVLVILNGAAVIAIDGGSGTLSEIGHALDLDRPIAGLDTHPIPGIEAVDSPTEAVEFVEARVG